MFLERTVIDGVEIRVSNDDELPAAYYWEVSGPNYSSGGPALTQRGAHRKAVRAYRRLKKLVS